MKKIVLSGIVASILLSHCFVGIARSEEERKVREIEVRNNKVISTQTILSKLQTKIGTPYTGTILSDDIKRLYASGLFRDVGADIEEKDGGVKVVFTVQEKPVLAKIVFAGNKRIRTKRLLSQMKIKQNEIFDQFKLKEDIEELKKFYAKKGYSSAVITTSEEEKDSKVTVTISVVEHARMRVRKINVDGNTSFAKNRLIKLLKTKRKGWFTSGFFDNDVFQEDTERLLAFYRAEGFIDVKVVSRFDENQTSGAISVTFVIEEGKQYKVGAIAVTGNTVFTRDELLKTVVLQPDTVYSESKLREDISALQSHYFDAGYIASFVKADTVLNAETGNVDLNYAVNEGDIAYVDKINVQGNSRTKDEVIRREMRLYPGDRYNGEKLRRSRQRLYNLGYFEEVSFDTKEQPSTLPDKYDLDVFVKESKTGEFSFGAGYSSVDQFIGFIDLTQRNFDLFNFPMFTGAGQKLRIRMEFGSEKKDYELGFVEPWFL
ncbi:MAG: outer membrane protein assembly factor BamA, partial [Candidatus Omnitrophica bacterium]|nr:outer membrane protein assembly factor BamA [Candidatus Omnitrophota bacterium]